MQNIKSCLFDVSAAIFTQVSRYDRKFEKLQQLFHAFCFYLTKWEFGFSSLLDIWMSDRQRKLAYRALISELNLNAYRATRCNIYALLSHLRSRQAWTYYRTRIALSDRVKGWKGSCFFFRFSKIFWKFPFTLRCDREWNRSDVSLHCL